MADDIQLRAWTLVLCPLPVQQGGSVVASQGPSDYSSMTTPDGSPAMAGGDIVTRAEVNATKSPGSASTLLDLINGLNRWVILVLV